MKQFVSFIRKEFLHIFRDTRTMMILLAMPIIQILLFGYAISTEVRNASVAILAPHHDARVDEVVQRFDASRYFTVTRMLQSDADILPAFQQGEVSLVLCFNTDNTAVQLLTDGTEPNQASLVTQYALGILQSQFSESLTPMTSGSVSRSPADVSVRLLYNPQSRSAYNFVPGVMGLIMMLICAMMTSIAIVREKEQGTMEVLLASPLPPLVIILAKMVPYFTLSLVNMAPILLLAHYVMEVPIVGSLALILTLCIVYILLALAFGLLVSNLVASQMAAMLISGMGLMMPVMLLSGMVFPIESMPALLQYLSAIVPARWFIAAMRGVMIQGCTLPDVWHQLLILCLMLVVILTIALRKFKVRLA